MSKTLPAKYYQGNKERLQKKAAERYQSFAKTVTKICQMIKDKSLLSIEKILQSKKAASS